MKGIIVAGGHGTRLRPLTLVVNKQLLPIYDKPMILYPMQTLIDMGVRDILIISSPEHLGSFTKFLGDGSEYGVRLTYKVQREAGGIAQAVLLGEDFVGKEQFAVILGDSIYEYAPKPPSNCGIVLKEVDDPRRFGVYNDDVIEEKPTEPKSNLAVTGLYFYFWPIFGFIMGMQPSARGELEITDVNNWCLKNMPTDIIRYDGFWADTGTPDSLLDTANFIRSKRKNV